MKLFHKMYGITHPSDATSQLCIHFHGIQHDDPDHFAAAWDFFQILYDSFHFDKIPSSRYTEAASQHNPPATMFHCGDGVVSMVSKHK